MIFPSKKGNSPLGKEKGGSPITLPVSENTIKAIALYVSKGRPKSPSKELFLTHHFDSGAGASEITALNLEYFNPQQETLAILGKGDQFRLIELENKTVQLLEVYINRCRTTPKPLYLHRLFIRVVIFYLKFS